MKLSVFALAAAVLIPLWITALAMAPYDNIEEHAVADPLFDVPTPVNNAASLTDLILSQKSDESLVNQLIGAGVRTRHEDIGTVADLLLDRDMKVIGYIFSIGGLLGIGDKFVGVSKDAISIEKDRNGHPIVVTSFSKKQLQDAASFVAPLPESLIKAGQQNEPPEFTK